MPSTFRTKYLKYYHRKNKDRYNKNSSLKLGTTNFKQKMCRKSDGSPDFNAEYEAIQKEKNKINKQWLKPSWSSHRINDDFVLENKETLRHKHGMDFL